MIHALHLSGGDESPGLARRALTEWLADRVDPAALHDARLLVSELVTNSVRHGPAGGVDLRVELGEDRIRVEVADGGGRFRARKPVEPPPDAVGGRGLLIVDRVATAWGTAHDGRNVVWFEL